jgi:hypothetical protein
MAGILTVDTIQSDSSYASTLNVASKMNFVAGMQIGGQDTTFGGMRNRIINGDMRIDQRGATQTNPNPAYVTDRWNAVTYGSATVAQSSTAPTGFTNSLLWTTTSATAPSAGQWAALMQGIEGYNIVDLDWGSATAKTVTLSFWVRSSTTGTYSVGIGNATTTGDVPGTQTRSFVSTYIINAANTWEQKTIVIAGDTTGTWLKTNGLGICVTFDCGSGSTYQTGTLNTWQAGSKFRATGSVGINNTSSGNLYITGVQLEKGSAASAFEQLHYGHQLALCYRYNYVWYRRGASSDSNIALPGVGSFYGATSVYTNITFPVTMRTTPSLTAPNRTNAFLFPSNNNSYYSPTVSLGHQFYNGCFISAAITGTATAGHATNSSLQTADWVNGDYLGFSAEL